MKGRSLRAAHRGPLRVGCVLAGLVFSAGQLNALEPAQAITQYAHAVWTRGMGQLPAGVLALAQTPNGYLWIGTDSGMLRFDGVRFQSWRPPSNQQLAGEHISYVLAAARDGSLWVSTREGLSHWKDSKVRNYQTSKGPAGPRVAAILIDRAGTVWAGTAGYRSGGLCRVEGNDLRCYTAADGLPGWGVFSVFEDRRGSLWVGGLGLYRWKPGEPRVDHLLDPRGVIFSIAEDRQGQIWVAGGGLKRLVDDQLVTYQALAPGQKLQPRTLLADRDGGLWIGTHGQGLLRLYEGRIDRFTHADGLSNDIVRCLLEDREGNIWAGTEGGLDRFREFAVTTISKREGLSQSTVSSVLAAEDGSVWLGTAGGLNRLQGIRVIPYEKRNGLPSDNITGMFKEQGGRLWVMTYSGLAYFDGGGFRSLPLPFVRGTSLFAAAEDRDHTVWLSDPEYGLIRLQDARLKEVVSWSQFENKQVWALESDPKDGGLWLGFAQGGIARYQPGQPIRGYSIPGRAGGEPVMDLHRMRDGALWIATQAGLSRFENGHFAMLTVANGLPCDRIHSMVEDDHGALWLNMACGLVRISGADLSQWSANPANKVRARVYDAGDGMRIRPIATGYFRRAAKSADGRLWFVIGDGVAVVNPNHLPENRLSPPVQIEQITVGERTYPIHSDLRLPPLTKELRIDYTALSFVAPDRVHFRYRLDGFDREWNDAAGRRQAVYTNLPPKHYRFRVMACNNDGVWNETGASCDFSISPAFYQTNWFRLLCVSGVALLLWSIHRLRLRQMELRLNLSFQERLAERTRIAREMHDTLLQNLCGFALQLDGLSKMTALSEAARECLYEIRREAEQCLREAREFVWELRAPTLEEKDLPEALREAGEQIVSGAPVRFNMTVMGNRRPAPEKLQRHLLRIVQEATRNAVRYSRANEIAMQIAYLDSDLIRVQMRDDGCGFDLEKALREKGHWGLITMRERAQQIGAELKISSAPGHGTELEIVVPIKCLE